MEYNLERMTKAELVKLGKRLKITHNIPFPATMYSKDELIYHLSDYQNRGYLKNLKHL